jgi:hypothetical protein
MHIPTGEAREVDALIAEKRTWIDTPKDAGNAAVRHQAIGQVNEKLQKYLEDQRYELERAIAQANQNLGAAQVCNSREYAYCLFPEDRLREFFRI